MIVSMPLGEMPRRFIATSDEAPQSMRKRVALVSTSIHVLNRPPLPNASPLPTNTIRMPEKLACPSPFPQAGVSVSAGSVDGDDELSPRPPRLQAPERVGDPVEREHLF